MRRRDFLTLVGGAATAWPLEARAQQPTKLPTIGFLGPSTASAISQWTAAFAQRLRELGWVEGRNVSIEYRWAEGRTGRFAGIAAEMVQATSVIPIGFAVASDPVGNALVEGLSQPGGNVTGLSVQQADLAA